MIGALISAGASLLGGLLASSSEKKRDKANAAAAAAANARNEERVDSMNADVRRRAEMAAAVPIVTTQDNWSGVDVDSMMMASERAGFNPATWLRNGGMQAYTQTASRNTVYGSNLMDAALAGSSIFQEGAPPMATARGVGEVVGSALTTGASQWVNDANQERQNQFQLQLLDKQLNSDQMIAGMRFGAPTAFQSGATTTAKNSAALGRYPVKDDYGIFNIPGQFGNFLGDLLGVKEPAKYTLPNYPGMAANAVTNWLSGVNGAISPGFMELGNSPPIKTKDFYDFMGE